VLHVHATYVCSHTQTYCYTQNEPPPLPDREQRRGQSTKLYDSVHAATQVALATTAGAGGAHAIRAQQVDVYVVYNSCMAYPEYILTYQP
jgi:hypothetical protein